MTAVIAISTEKINAKIIEQATICVEIAECWIMRYFFMVQKQQISAYFGGGGRGLMPGNANVWMTLSADTFSAIVGMPTGCIIHCGGRSSCVIGEINWKPSGGVRTVMHQQATHHALARHHSYRPTVSGCTFSHPVGLLSISAFFSGSKRLSLASDALNLDRII